MKLIILLTALLLSGCATGRVCFDQKQIKYEIPIGKGEPWKPDKWHHCQGREWRKLYEQHPFPNR